MIEFNLKDHYLDSIRLDSKMFNAITQKSYRVYGLAQNYKKELLNPVINISYSLSKNDLKIEPLVKFFKSNGIQITYNSSDVEAESKIYIGLRKDLRQNIILAGTILQTLIYYFESKLVLDDNFRIPIAPNFPEGAEEKEEEE